MGITLHDILAATRARVHASKQSTNRAALDSAAAKHQPRGFRAALVRASGSGRPAIIAELKKASPSRGVIRGSFPVARLALDLQEAGAAALSVLTDEPFFQGSLANLNEASAATELPCLRKDFIIDEFQLVESRANHADAVLLIAAAVSGRDLTALAAKAREMGLDVLCEVHDEGELQRALDAECNLIGVNSRDLKTFTVNLDTAIQLGAKVPASALRVAESGIDSAEDIRRLRGAGYQAFLIGESLMKADRPGDALRRLIAESKAPPIGTAGVSSWSTGTKD